MIEESRDDLFNIRVNEISKKYIRKLYSVALTSYILNIFFNLVLVCLSVYNLVRNGSSFNGSFREIFYSIYPFYIIAYSITALVGNYFYFGFVKKIRRSLVDSNEEAYNLSFKYVYINSLIFMISSIVAVAFILLEVTVVFGYSSY